jgi:hypothetical protein
MEGGMDALIEYLKESSAEHAFHEYLYNLAVVAITFAGFAAIAISLIGKDSTRFHFQLIRNHFILGFAVVGACFLPQLLRFDPYFDNKRDALRLASVMAALIPAIFCFTYPAVRRRESGQVSIPGATKALLFFYFFVSVLMFSNLFADDPGLYAFALTMQQFINVVTFLVGFRYFVPQSQPDSKTSHQLPASPQAPSGS